MTIPTRLLGLAGTAALLALLGVAPTVAAAATPSATPSATPTAPATSATPVAGVHSVTLTPAKPSVTSPVTVTVAWCLPDDSTPGSTLALAVPAQLTPLTTGFPLRDKAGDLVASTALHGNSIELTAAPYVATHHGVCGTLSFPASINAAQVTVNTPNALTFRTGSTALTTTFTPTETVGAKVDEAITYGTWGNPYDQGRTTKKDALIWYLESPEARSPGGAGEVLFSDTATRGQFFDCAALRVEVGHLDRYHHFIFAQTYPGRPTSTCTTTAAQVRISGLQAGTVARLVLPTSISATAKAPFTNSGQVTVDGNALPRVRSLGVVHYLPAGTASGAAAEAAASASAASSAASASAAGQAPSTKAASARTPVQSNGSQHGGLALLIGLGAAAVVMAGLGIRARRRAAAS